MAKMFKSIFLWHEAAHGTKVPLTDSRWDIVEPAYDLLPWFSFIVYGIPEDDHEQISEECYEGNFENAQKIGEVCGHLIMGAVIEGTERTLDDVCDENSADLQYVYSAMKRHLALARSRGFASGLRRKCLQRSMT